MGERLGGERSGKTVVVREKCRFADSTGVLEERVILYVRHRLLVHFAVPVSEALEHGNRDAVESDQSKADHQLVELSTNIRKRHALQLHVKSLKTRQVVRP